MAGAVYPGASGGTGAGASVYRPESSVAGTREAPAEPPPGGGASVSESGTPETVESPPPHAVSIPPATSSAAPSESARDLTRSPPGHRTR